MLETGGIYHVYNRGVNRQVVFRDNDCYSYFLRLLDHVKHFNTALTQHAFKKAARGEDSLALTNLKDSSLTSHHDSSPASSSDPDQKDLLNLGGLVEVAEQPKALLQKAIPVKLHAYCLMPNHFHLLLEQLVDGGVSHYVRRVATSYSKTFNSRFNRTGHLWEGRFKAKQIEDGYSYLQVVRYIHLNPIHSETVKVNNLAEYPYSSYREAIGSQSESGLCDYAFLRGLISSPAEYREFVDAEIDPRAQQMLEDLVIETPFEE